MLREFAEYLVGLKDNKTYDINGQTYSDNHLHRIAPYIPRPEQITVNGLDSIVQLVRKEVDRLPAAALPLFVRVAGPRDVYVYSGLDNDMKRYELYHAACDAPEFKTGWRDYNSAIIELRSKFITNEGSEYLLDLLSRISKEDGVTTMDNGVTQQVEARSGISLKVKEAIRPRVKLIPYRTFSEIDQPESEFLVRVDDDGNIGFFEADGGAWKIAAKEYIRLYLDHPEYGFGLLSDNNKTVVMM